jgi:DNA-binding winged helix-turn-helix (wHTH) protein
LRYTFNDVTIDLSRFELLREGCPQPIQPRVLDLLVYLIRHRTRVISRDELLREVWRGITVSNAALSQAIMEARRVVGDAADIQDIIRTVRGRGYQVVAEVKEFDDVFPAAPRHLLTESMTGKAPLSGSGSGKPLANSELLARIDHHLSSLRSENDRLLLVACRGDETNGLLESYAQQAHDAGCVTVLAIVS